MIWKRPCWLLAERRGSRSLEYRSGKQDPHPQQQNGVLYKMILKYPEYSEYRSGRQDPHPQQQNGALYKMILKYLEYLEYRSGRQDPHPQAVFPEQNGAI